MKIITHSGNFHPDDVCAVATLLLIYPDAEVVRTRDEKVINEKDKEDIVLDLGRVYDPTNLIFDHHQDTCSDLGDLFKIIGFRNGVGGLVTRRCVLT